MIKLLRIAKERWQSNVSGDPSCLVQTPSLGPMHSYPSCWENGLWMAQRCALPGKPSVGFPVLALGQWLTGLFPLNCLYTTLGLRKRLFDWVSRKQAWEELGCREFIREVTLHIRSEEAREKNREGKQANKRHIVELVTTVGTWGLASREMSEEHGVLLRFVSLKAGVFIFMWLPPIKG